MANVNNIFHCISKHNNRSNNKAAKSHEIRNSNGNMKHESNKNRNNIANKTSPGSNCHHERLDKATSLGNTCKPAGQALALSPVGSQTRRPVEATKLKPQVLNHQLQHCNEPPDPR